ncbi:MAG: hypothetical protein ACR652_05430 [Methylocystis sp.]
MPEQVIALAVTLEAFVLTTLTVDSNGEEWGVSHYRLRPVNG